MVVPKHSNAWPFQSSGRPAQNTFITFRGGMMGSPIIVCKIGFTIFLLVLL
jgi:hypothetical protein